MLIDLRLSSMDASLITIGSIPRSALLVWVFRSMGNYGAAKVVARNLLARRVNRVTFMSPWAILFDTGKKDDKTNHAGARGWTQDGEGGGGRLP